MKKIIAALVLLAFVAAQTVVVAQEVKKEAKTDKQEMKKEAKIEKK